MTTPLARERSNLRSECTVFYRPPFCRIVPIAGHSARHARILDSVCLFKTRRFRFAAISRATRDPMAHFLDSVGGSENRPRLSLENGATFLLKVTCFTVCLLAGSHRLRATAPDLRASSTVLPNPGSKGVDSAPAWSVFGPAVAKQSKTSTLTVARLRFLPDPGPCPLQPPCPGGDAKVREKTRHFGHVGL